MSHIAARNADEYGLAVRKKIAPATGKKDFYYP